MTPLVWCVFLAAAATGAVARFVLDASVRNRTGADQPWGTFVVNVSGCFLLGLLTGAALYRGLGPVPQQVLGTGALGSFTTFSAVSFETVRLAETGMPAAAALNAVGSLASGAAAAAAGLALMGVM